jgi:hypothetical protein
MSEKTNERRDFSDAVNEFLHQQEQKRIAAEAAKRAKDEALNAKYNPPSPSSE